MKKPILAFFLLLITSVAQAQNITTVTAVVADPIGKAYSFGTYTVTLINTTGQQPTFGGNPNFQQNFSGSSLDTNGNLSISIPSVTVMQPSPGLQWQFNVCANPGAIVAVFPKPILPCFTYTSTGTQISGTSVVLTASFNAVPIPTIPSAGGSSPSAIAATIGGTYTIFATQAATAAGSTIFADGNTVGDGVTNSTTTVTSASGLFSCPGDIGKTIDGIDGAGLTTIATQLIAGCVSSTQITLTTAAVSTRAGVRLIWGHDDTTALTAANTAYLAAIAKQQVCLVLPAGMSIVNNGRLLQPASLSYGTFPGCIYAQGQYIIHPTITTFNWGGASQIEFLSTAQGTSWGPTNTPTYISGIYIWGGGILGGSGACTVPASTEGVFWGQAEVHNSGVVFWCDGVSNLTGMVIDNDSQFFNISCINAGNICASVQGSTDLAPTKVHGGTFQTTTGVWPIQVTTSYESDGVKYLGNPTAAGGDMDINGVAKVHSTRDQFGPSRQSNITVEGTTNVVWLDKDIINGAVNVPMIIDVTGTSVYVKDTVLTGGGGTAQIYLNSGGGTIIDECGNKISGGNIVVPQAGTMLTDCVVGSDTQAAKTTAQVAKTLFTVGANTALFAVHISVECTTTSAAATSTPAVLYTDTSGTVQTVTGSAATCTALGANSITSQDVTFRAKNATAIQYQTTIANTPTYDITAQVTQKSLF